MAEILSQEEIDALLEIVEEEDIGTVDVRSFKEKRKENNKEHKILFENFSIIINNFTGLKNTFEAVDKEYENLNLKDFYNFTFENKDIIFDFIIDKKLGYIITNYMLGDEIPFASKEQWKDEIIDGTKEVLFNTLLNVQDEYNTNMHDAELSKESEITFLNQEKYACYKITLFNKKEEKYSGIIFVKEFKNFERKIKNNFEELKKLLTNKYIKVNNFDTFYMKFNLEELEKLKYLLNS